MGAFHAGPCPLAGRPQGMERPGGADLGPQGRQPVPREGAERFIFGTPTDIEAKFGRIRTYYESIAPSRETPYKTVDVRFDSQIICRNK